MSGPDRPRDQAILGTVDLDIGYSMTLVDDWRQITLSPAYRLRCDPCHSEGSPALQEMGMLCIEGPQVGRFLCDRHYNQLPGAPAGSDGPDPFAVGEEED